VHARAVGIKDADNLDLQIMLAMVIEEQSLRTALTFVIATAEADRVDSTPVAFGLRVNLRVAIDLARRRLQDPGPYALCQPEHVNRTVYGGLGGLHGIVLVMNRARRTSEVVDAVDLNIKGEGYVVAHQLEIWMAQQVRNVAFGSRKKIVNAKHVVAPREQTITEVGAEEPGTTADKTLIHFISLFMNLTGKAI
jgi:hypothetical protein